MGPAVPSSPAWQRDPTGAPTGSAAREIIIRNVVFQTAQVHRDRWSSVAVVKQGDQINGAGLFLSWGRSISRVLAAGFDLKHVRDISLTPVTTCSCCYVTGADIVSGGSEGGAATEMLYVALIPQLAQWKPFVKVNWFSTFKTLFRFKAGADRADI